MTVEGERGKREKKQRYNLDYILSRSRGWDRCRFCIKKCLIFLKRCEIYTIARSISNNETPNLDNNNSKFLSDVHVHYTIRKNTTRENPSILSSYARCCAFSELKNSFHLRIRGCGFQRVPPQSSFLLNLTLRTSKWLAMHDGVTSRTNSHSNFPDKFFKIRSGFSSIQR